MEQGLTGQVENRNDGVHIRVRCSPAGLDRFIDAVKRYAPAASNIASINYELVEEQSFHTFSIVKSSNVSEEITQVSPDIAVCQDCLNDMTSQPHRIRYPFINCTYCGPRFSIIRNLPYDRTQTTMAPFNMCPLCRNEYGNVQDRRFHAQPVACNDCGPVYSLVTDGEQTHDFESLLDATARMLDTGKIVAIKGIGGYQLACDAQQETSVALLRKRKNREGKPFAVMFRDIGTLEHYAFLSKEEKRSLESWRRPIAILRSRRPLAESVSVGFPTIGAMLPYMPFHHMLFEKTKLPAFVLTSGNLSDEPIVISDEEAKIRLGPISDALLVYNREIYNRTDDSVVFCVNERERLIRRSRGYVPEPISLKTNSDGIFAAGAELVNCFAVGKGKQAFLSQHIGDLKNLETLEFYSESFERFNRLFRVEPMYVVHDLHPDYLSTRFAKSLHLPSLAVQHHHAHIASAMAESGLDEQVIGVSMDGTGLGQDGRIWGGEFLLGDLASFSRFTHFDYIPLPGGDKVTKEPWRTAISYLYKYFGRSVMETDLPVFNKVDRSKVFMLTEVIDKDINCPQSSSAGRLFDAVSALLGLCTETKFHAEAPMRLEAVMKPGIRGIYPFQLKETVSFAPTIEAILEDLKNGMDRGIISSRFHNTLIEVVLKVVSCIREETGINKVVLSGGTFQNRYLLEWTEKKLKESKFTVFSQRKVPSNDGGIALGQLAIAAKHRELGLFGSITNK